MSLRALSQSVFAASLGCLAALPALAAGDGEGPGTWELIWQAANLALLLGVLYFVGRKPARKFFSDRREQIRGDLDNSSELLKRAESRYGEWQSKLADLESDLEQIRETARDRANAEREAILADARASAERIRDDATAAVDQELRRARNELRGEASDLAIELAADLLRDQVGPEDRERLLDEFIGRVGQSQENR